MAEDGQLLGFSDITDEYFKTFQNRILLAISHTHIIGHNSWHITEYIDFILHIGCQQTITAGQVNVNRPRNTGLGRLLNVTDFSNAVSHQVSQCSSASICLSFYITLLQRSWQVRVGQNSQPLRVTHNKYIYEFE